MLYSERSGMPRGFSLEDLVDQIWESLRDTAVGQYGLFDQAFGYYVSEWTQDPADTKYIAGKVDHIDQLFNRQLRARLGIGYQEASPDVETPRNGPALGYTDKSGKFRHEPPPAFYRDAGMLFDFLEILYDLVAAPKFDPAKKRHTSFAKKDAQEVFREFISEDLMIYQVPHEMLANGQIVPLGNELTKQTVEGLVLMDERQQISKTDYTALNDAIRQFYHEGASQIEKKTAIANVHELLMKYREKVIAHMLRDDERDLFRMAEDFAIRNAGAKQKRNYDKDIWYDWMFSVQLASAVTIIRILAQQQKDKPAEVSVEGQPKKRGRGRPPKVAAEPAEPVE
jgi:hypothetical protein